MRVGLEMRHISEGACGGITPLLAETLSRIFDLAPRDQFYFFGTMFNQELFSNRFPSLQKYSVPLVTYWERLESNQCRCSIVPTWSPSSTRPIRSPLEHEDLDLEIIVSMLDGQYH